MKNDPKRKNTKKANSRKWKAQWKKIVSTLAAVTVFCTTYALILPAITVNSNTYCGLEEHEHTEACYTKELICGLTEGEVPGAEGGQADAEAPQTEMQTVTETVTETVIELQQVLVDEGHVHQDSCYEETRNLVCGLEETESKEAVLDEEGNVIEEAVEGHTHTDECYQVERVLVCGQEEREPVYEEQEVEVEKEVQKEVEVPVEQPAQPAQPAGEPHVHTDACYKEVLTCGKEEHKHVDECFSNPTLDLETAADWEKTLPKEDELTENWAEDVLTIAKSQLGYKESSRNFKAVNGDRKGYTRYGARFGAPYSDWCAMFIQFAMHYAGVDERLMPGNPSVSKWIENVKKIENYFEPADYTPVPGDIMFIDWDKVVEGVERDGDHIGIVAEVKTTEETTPDGAKLEVPTSIVTIEGNLDNEVKYNTYKIDDERILGYSHMPEKPETEEELEERVEEIEALIEGKELVEAEEGAEGEEPAEGTEEENEEIVVDTIIALASYTESGVQVNFEAPSSVFPEGTVDPALNVVEILPGTPEYDEYFAQAQANAGTEVLNARFFDISVVDLEGNEIKLNDESLAKVEIIFPENETMTTEGNIDVLHFAEEGLEVLESQVQGREEVEAITFDTTSFSPYGVVQTPKSGEGSTDGSSKPALAEKREKSDGTDEYVVTSWEALEKLIESGTYKDTDGSEKTSTTLTSIDVVIDGIIAANSQIDTKGKTINLSGINDAKVYVDSEATSLAGGMFLVNGGSFKVDNVVFSGKKATYNPGTGSDCAKDTSHSKITISGTTLYIDGIKLCKDGNGMKADNNGENPIGVADPSSPKTLLSSITSDKEYYLVNIDASTDTAFLRTTSDGTGVEWYKTNNPTDSNKLRWKLRDGDVLENVANSNIIIYKGSTGSGSVTGEKDTKDTQDCSNGNSAPTEGTWTIDDDSNINNLVNTETKGFFITAENGAKVEIKDNTSFQDMIYDATTKNVAPNPIYVAGTGTEFKLNSDTATIKNNRSYIPALSKDFVTKGRKLLYQEVLDNEPRENDPTWDLNPSGNTERKKHDDGTKAAGGIFITDSGTVNLIKGTIGGDNTENVNLGNTGIAGAVYIDGGTLNQSGGSIKGNHAFKGAVVVDGEASTYNLTTGSVTKNDSTMHGGGISALNEGNVIVGKEDQNCDTNDVPVISYNRTLDQGGGIYVHSDNVKLRRAKIEHNAAHFMGGGIYVYGGDSKQDDKNSVLIIDDTYVTRNYAGNQAFIDGEEGFGFDNKDWNPNDRTYGEGGGVWSCTYGSFIMNGNEIHIWNNDAHSPGKDFYKHAKGNASGIITEFLADPKDDYYDTKETNNTADDSKFDVSNFTPITGRLSLINKASTSAYETEMEGLCDAVKITDNRAGYAGGGIGSNGIVSYKPLNNQDIYRPEFIFSKSFKNKGSNSSDISTAGKSATFNVTVTNLVNPNEEPAVYTGIVLQDGAKIVDDPNGVDPKGYSVDNWTATITLPQMFKPDGTSIYKEIINKNNHSMGHSQGYYNIDEMIKIVIEEVDMTDGVVNVLNTYDLILGDMTYSYNSPPPLSNYQEDVTITYHDIELETSLINEKKNGHGQVQITKKDASDGAELTHDDFNFQYRKVTKSGSNYNPIDGENWVAFTQSGAVHTSDILDSDSYYEIQESGTENGYTGLGASVYIYVDILGNVRIDSKNGMDDFIKDEATTNLTVEGDESIVGKVLTFTVYNKPETGLDIVKVSNKKDADGNPIAVTGGTTFQIKNFNFGKTGNSMASPVTITLNDSNSFRITDIIEAFKGTGPNGSNLTESQIVNSKFYIQETQTHENGRYNGLQHVIPFTITKNTHGAYVFTPLTKAEVEAHNNAKDSSGTSFYEAGKVRSVINFNDSDKAVYVEWADASGTKIKDVDIDSGKGSIKYTVTNEMKPIQIKVAKLDENGDPLPGATFKLRTAEGAGADPLLQTPNTPDDGIYTFVNAESGSKSNFLKPGNAYYVWEDVAPNGYAPLSVGAFIEIDEHGVVSLVSDAETIAANSTGNNKRYNLTNGATATALAAAIISGDISISNTVDDDGVVTINIKNYPKTSISVKKTYDDSVPQAYQKSVKVALFADGFNKGEAFEKTIEPNKVYTWTDLPKYRTTSEGLVQIQYTVKELFESSNNVFKVSYDYEPEVVTPQQCDTTRTIIGWSDIGAANINGRDFRIVIGNNALYLNSSKGLAYTSATDSSKYNQMLWSAKYFNAGTYGTYEMGLHQVIDGTSYVIAYSNQDASRLVSSTGRYNQLEYNSRTKLIRYWYNGYYYYLDGDLTATTSSSYAKQATFQVPIYEDNTTCTPGQVTPALWTITNYYDTVDLDFEKKWQGDEGYTRPTSIQVQLLQNDKPYGDPVTVSSPDWKYSWKELPKYADGDVAEYTVEELLDDDHYSSSAVFGQGTGEKVITGWRAVTYDQLRDASNQPFRIVAQGQAYYLDANNQLKTTSRYSSAYYDRMLWKTTKYETGTYGNGAKYVDMGFQSAYNSSYYIAHDNSSWKLKASTNPSSYRYDVGYNQLMYEWYSSWYAFSGYIDQYCNGYITFEVPEYSTENANDMITMTNKYEEHEGLKLVKVDESGNSDKWSKQAEFTLYHMKSELAPVTLTLENGEYLLKDASGLVPNSGTSYFFIVETETPHKDNNEYAKLGTAIPIKVGANRVVSLATYDDLKNNNYFKGAYDVNTKTLAAATSGDKTRPAIKVDWALIGDGEDISWLQDQNRLEITAKNTPINNDLELIKIDNSTPAGEVDGAAFSIKNESTGSYVSPAEGGWWTTSDGKWKVSNLAPGTYTIKEESAPKNYVKSNATVTVVVDEYTGEITVTPSDTNVVVDVRDGTTSVSFKFINQISSYELPEAGGIGTTILYIAGAILVIGAGVLLIVRKKMNK